MSHFQHIFIDLDGTIFNFNKCEKAALNETFSAHSIKFNEETLHLYLKINSQLWKMYEGEEITLDFLMPYRFELLFNNLMITNQSPRQISEEYQNNLGKLFFFEEGALTVIKKLYKKYNLFIVTNGNLKTQMLRIQKAKIGQYFKDVFVSEEIGYHKPQIEFFDVCFQRMNLRDTKTALIIGDSLSSDIMGGNIAGINTCWYNPKRMKAIIDIPYNYEITSLKQLFDIL